MPNKEAKKAKWVARRPKKSGSMMDDELWLRCAWMRHGDKGNLQFMNDKFSDRTFFNANTFLIPVLIERLGPTTYTLAPDDGEAIATVLKARKLIAVDDGF